MERQYKCIKTFKQAGWVEGKTYKLEEDQAVEAVEAKLLELVPEDETKVLIKRAIAEWEDQRAPARASDTATIVAAVFEKLHGSHGPLAVRVVQDEADKTRGLGEFLQCVGLAGDPQSRPDRKAEAIETLAKTYNAHPDSSFGDRYAKSQENMGATRKTALAESAGVTGGYTVPTEYAMQLLQFRPEDNVMVGFTDDYPMTTRELKMPVLDQFTPLGVAGQSNYFGGVVAYWTAEAATRQETEPRFREATLVANELSGYALASRNVLYDNKVALEQRLTQIFGGAVAWYRDYAYLAGDGVGKPRGIINHPATLGVNRAVTNTVGYADICNMFALLMPQSIKSSFWVMQQSVLGVFLQMADTNGQLVVQPYYPTYVAGMRGGPATVEPVMSMLGRPIKTTEKVSTLGTTGDLLLIDPRQYFTGSLQSLEIAASEHYRFINNQVTYRFLYRGDGEPWPSTYFTLQDNTTKISPFVQLLTHT